MGSAPRCRTFRPWSIGTFTVVCWSLMNLIAVHPRRQRTNSGDSRRRHLLLRSGRSARACDPVSDGRSVIARCKKRWTKRVREKDQQEKAPARQAVTAGHRMCTAIERRAAQRAAGNPGAEIVGRGAFRGTSALRHKRSFRWRGWYAIALRGQKTEARTHVSAFQQASASRDIRSSIFFNSP